jgi:cytoplasmic iron level regulating protein YaaA (DUF328/UPF0246 family)
MLILLPPSEKKKVAKNHEDLELDTLTFAAELSSARAEITAGYTHTVTSPAIEIYAGVLYQSLGWDSLSTKQRKRANSRVLIVSALFGLVKPLDQIFEYKLKIDSRFWREPISRVSAKFVDELIIDCRSSTYKGVWQINPINTVEVRVFKVTNGDRSVITHMSKKYRGELVRFLLTQPSEPATPVELHQLAASAFNCELQPPIDGQPWLLDLLISE